MLMMMDMDVYINACMYMYGYVGSKQNNKPYINHVNHAVLVTWVGLVEVAGTEATVVFVLSGTNTG